METYEDILLSVETHLTVAISATNSVIRQPAEICSIPLKCATRFDEAVCWDQSSKNPIIQGLVDILKAYPQS